MLRTPLVVAVRALRQHLGYTVINAGGLAVGIAACLLIALFVRHELSYDRFHGDADRIHRIVDDEIFTDMSQNWGRKGDFILHLEPIPDNQKAVPEQSVQVGFVRHSYKRNVAVRQQKPHTRP